MVTNILSGTIQGLECKIINVEADVSSGLPCMDMIGLLGTEVKEAKERVRVALKNCGISLPPARITINISPANIRKEGTAYDIPIAVALLASMKMIPEENTRGILFAGELSLDGEIKRIHGILPMALEAKRQGIKHMIIPKGNAREGAVVEGVKITGVSNIKELIEYLGVDPGMQDIIIPPVTVDIKSLFNEAQSKSDEDYIDLCGQESLKRALMIAAAGFHNVLMIGPPGAGKTMAAKRMPGILPPLSIDESMEVSKIYSVCGLLDESKSMVLKRPFMSPHHTISDAAMSGGGRIPGPGMISRAHKGILFLDEAVHFSSTSLEILRQPMEDKKVIVSRTYGSYEFPAEFMLVAAVNPCPCGNYPDMNSCTCTPEQIRRYLSKLSGPILDRIDICIETPKITLNDLSGEKKGMSSGYMREKVMNACEIQKERYKGKGIEFNSQLSPKDMDEFILLGKAERQLVEEVYEKMNLSARGYHRILKVARTIADIEGDKDIKKKHIMEAVCYRGIEDKYWGNGI